MPLSGGARTTGKKVRARVLPSGNRRTTARRTPESRRQACCGIQSRVGDESLTSARAPFCRPVDFSPPAASLSRRFSGGSERASKLSDRFFSALSSRIDLEIGGGGDGDGVGGGEEDQAGVAGPGGLGAGDGLRAHVPLLWPPQARPRHDRAHPPRRWLRRHLPRHGRRLRL
ncbi:hypothetical protein EUGRSUZ_H00475 [Eucalyptus grandis]|uniref:Uncharacterized protein n=3 Tax=Eucalyptus grandis TaxID=71139 RepID=A0A059AUS7_EUCGR|nr:hypothetical protein EUGRSUZ_H00475 [Eucalyptus grandis]KAK3414620.1 hypothetical protein EUGRSUZ_H00475 [Eucalyptus grandis]